MFKETLEGSTHSFGDGCVPPHVMPEKWETKLERTRAYRVLADTKFGKKLTHNLKAFIRSTLAEQRKEIVEKLIEDIPDYIVTNMVDTVADGTAVKYNLHEQKQQLKAKWLDELNN